MVLTSDDRTAPQWRDKSRGPCPRRHGPQVVGSDRPPITDGDRMRRSDAEQVDHEDQGLAGLDRRGGALVAVGEVRGDGQLATAADLHALHALVPALDDAAAAEREAERR